MICHFRKDIDKGKLWYGKEYREHQEHYDKLGKRHHNVLGELGGAAVTTEQMKQHQEHSEEQQLPNQPLEQKMKQYEEHQQLEAQNRFVVEKRFFLSFWHRHLQCIRQ